MGLLFTNWQRKSLWNKIRSNATYNYHLYSTNPTNDSLATTPYNGLPTNSLDLINGITDRNLQNEYLYNYYGVADQRNFAERMARNSYQYAVEDMTNAGLNPYLMYTNGGSGAVVPSTNSYSSSGYASAIQTANAQRFKAQLDYNASKYKTDKEYEASLIRSFTNLIGSLSQISFKVK